MKRGAYAVFVWALLVGSAYAESKTIGEWLINIDRDRFTDKTNIVAVNFNSDGVIGLRCLAGNLSLGLTQARTKYIEGDAFGVALRVDVSPSLRRSARQSALILSK